MLKLMIVIDYLSTRLSAVLGASVSRWPRHDSPEVWAGLANAQVLPGRRNGTGLVCFGLCFYLFLHQD